MLKSIRVITQFTHFNTQSTDLTHFTDSTDPATLILCHPFVPI